MDIRQGPHQVAQKSKRMGCPRKDSKRTVLPERSLSSKLGAAMTSLRRLLEQAVSTTTVSPSANLADQERIQSLFDFRLGVNAYQLVNDFSAFKEKETRNSGNPASSGYLCIVIRVQFPHFDFAVIFLGEFVHQRRQHAARAAPGRPKIDQNGLVGLYDFRIKTSIRKLQFGHTNLL